MIYGIYVMKDEKVGFLAPMSDHNDEVAIRNFKYAITRSDSPMGNFKNDFTLFKLGSFDNMTGEVVLESTPKCLCRGGDFNE